MRLQFAYGFTLGEFDRVHFAAVVGIDLHKFGGILRGAGAETVQPERIAVSCAGVVVVVFAARVQLTVDQLPVVAPLALVVPERDAASEVLDLQGVVAPDRDDDLVAVPFARFVHRVGQNLKKRMLAAFKTVRAEDDCRTLAHAVRALQHGDTLVVICGSIFIALRHIASHSPIYGTFDVVYSYHDTTSMIFCQSANDIRYAVAKVEIFCYTKDVFSDSAYTGTRTAETRPSYPTR